jgi:hypothetical protein
MMMMCEKARWLLTSTRCSDGWPEKSPYVTLCELSSAVGESTQHREIPSEGDKADFGGEKVCLL